MELPLIIFGVLVVVVMGGIGVVIWLMKGENPRSQESPSSTLSDMSSNVASSKSKVSNIRKLNRQSTRQQPISSNELLKRIGVERDFSSQSEKLSALSSTPPPPPNTEKKKGFMFWKKTREDKIPQATSVPMLKDYLKSPENRSLEEKISQNVIPDLDKKKLQTVQNIAPAQAQSAPEIIEPEKNKIDQEIESAINTNELKANHTKLEELLKEKNVALEKTQTALENEFKNRKDFNKVKDILEKELKDVKIQARDARLKLGASQNEVENYKTKAAQLEEKITKLEKEILAKDDEIDKLLREKQTTRSLIEAVPILEKQTLANATETALPPTAASPVPPALPAKEPKNPEPPVQPTTT